ncbi:hypothetical protein EV2_008852 [Malus domestica]
MTLKQKYLISLGTTLEYSSPTTAVLPKKLPHLPEEQIRQVKMIPCSMWRQRAEGTSREKYGLHSQLSRRTQQSTCRFIRYFFKIKSISYHQGCNHSGR